MPLKILKLTSLSSKNAYLDISGSPYVPLYSFGSELSLALSSSFNFSIFMGTNVSKSCSSGVLISSIYYATL